MEALDFDFVVAVDPGYATQGITILPVDLSKHPIFFAASITAPTFDIERRILYQMDCIKQAMAIYGYNETQFFRALLIVEEYRASNHAAAAYFRGMYDALFRMLVAWRFPKAITIHPLNVQDWTYKIKPNRADMKALKPAEILEKHLLPQYRDFLPLDSAKLQTSLAISHLKDAGSPKVYPKEALGHAVDSLAMGIAGLVAFLRPAWLRGRSAAQQGWAHKIRETYPVTSAEPQAR